MNKIGMQPEDRFMVAIDRTLVVITNAGNVFGADIVNNELQPVFEFGGAKIGFNPEDRFAVTIGNTILIITQNGSVFGSEVTGRELGPVFQYNGSAIGFNPQDRFMVSVGLLLLVIADNGSVFGATVRGQTIGPISQIASGKIGFNPQDQFMVAMGHTLAVITTSGDVFAANVRQSDASLGTSLGGPTDFLHELDPVMQFGGAKIGFNPQDRFMVAMGQTLAVITSSGDVFAADVSSRDVGPIVLLNPPSVLDFDFNPITFDGGVPVGGSCHLTIRQDGSFTFFGHFHDSGAFEFNIGLVLGVKDSQNQIYTFEHSGHVAGSFEPGSDNDDWRIDSRDDRIANNWKNLAAGSASRIVAKVNADLANLTNSLIGLLGTGLSVFTILRGSTS